MRRALAVAVLVTASMATGPAARSLPVVPPLRLSPNVQLVGSIPGSWAGITFEDHYAFATGRATGLSVFDIADPAAPKLVGGLPIATSRTRTSTSAATRCSSPTTVRRVTWAVCST